MAKIPSRLEDLLPMAAFERVLDALNRPELSQKVREAVSKVGLREMNPLEQVQEAWQQARSWLESINLRTERAGSLMINATGRLFPDHDNRLPMANSTSLSLAQSAVAFHDRAACLARATEIVQRNLGVRHHVWLSDVGPALLASIRALARQRVLIARSDAIRVPGLGEIQALLGSIGATVVEVGPSNGASSEDWSQALCADEDSLILSLSPNGLPLESMIEHRRRLIELSGQSSVPLIDLMVDGSVDERLCAAFGFPSVKQSVRHSQHLVLFPTHFLLGGTKGVLCMAESQSAKLIDASAQSLGCELDCASINANLMAIQIANLEDELDHGLVGTLTINPENLGSRCARMATQISGMGPVINAVVVDSQHPLGPSPWDRYQLNNPIIELELNEHGNQLVDHLKAGSAEHPAVLLGSHGQRSIIDLRMVDPSEDHHIIAAIQELQS